MHTPGPWYVDSYRQPIGDTGDYDDVALIRTKGESHSFPSWVAEISNGLAQEANAHLIAAAPDLLAACQAAEKLLVCGAAGDMCREAIAKALGTDTPRPAA